MCLRCHKLSMGVWKFTPVKGWVHVVHRVEAVVEGEDVDGDACEVPTPIQDFGRVRLTAVMLEVVHGDDGPLREDVRNVKKDEELVRVQKQEKSLSDPQHEPLIHAPLEVGVPRVFLEGEISHIHLEDIGCDGRLEEKPVEQIPLERELARAHGIHARLCVAVVRQVVTGDECVDGVAVGE